MHPHWELIGGAMNTLLNKRDFFSILKAGMSGRAESELLRTRAEKILRRQVDTAMAGVTMVVGSNFLILLVIIGVMLDHAAPHHLAVWAIAVTSALVLLQVLGVRYSANPTGDPGRLRFWAWSLEIGSGLRALVWGAGILAFLPNGSLSTQMAIGVTAAAMMGGAAFALGALPIAAIMFVVLVGSAAVIALILAGTFDALMLAILTGVYMLYLSLAILNQGRTFFGNTLGEIINGEQKKTIGLLLKEFEDNSSDWLWHTDAEGYFVDPSARFASAAGVSAARLRELTFEDLIYVDLDGFNKRAVRLFVKRKEMRAVEVSLTIGGERRFWLLTAGPSFDDHGEFTGYRGVASDITASRAASERLEFLAHYDQLTGLLNRASYLEELNRAIVNTGPDSVGIVLFDLTGFKLVNDTLGHAVGDKLLSRLGERMRGFTAADRLFARLGGDEFALLINSSPSAKELEHAASEILKLFALPFVIGPHNVAIDASAGVALGGRDGKDAVELMRAADLALYSAKSSGRGQWLEFNENLASAYVRRQNLERGLREAIELEQLSLRFQPIVAVNTGEVSAFETLLRWQSPEFGAVGPAEFISIAEESGMIVPIGNWVLREATKACASCSDHIQICVNVSPVQLRNRNLVASVKDALIQSGLKPERLVLEITEGVFLEHNAQTDKTLHDLLALGVHISLDDFGTGYSSLSYLRSFPFSKVKIDKSFIDDIAKSGPDALIVKAIVDLADALGFEVVAEGVEDHRQLAELVRLGCGFVQGYLFSEPLARADVPAFMHDPSRIGAVQSPGAA